MDHNEFDKRTSGLSYATEAAGTTQQFVWVC